MLKILLFLGGMLCLSTGATQNNLNGCWRGVITQDEGGYRPEYSMELHLKQEGTKITGRSFVYFDKVYAEMQLEGALVGGKILQLKETKILASKKVDGMEWCIKQAVLSLVKTGTTWRLEGAWEGATEFGPCIPGRITLKKAIPRA